MEALHLLAVQGRVPSKLRGVHASLKSRTDHVTACRPTLLMGVLQAERPPSALTVMTATEAVAAVVCDPGARETDPIILSAVLQVSCMCPQFFETCKGDQLQ